MQSTNPYKKQIEKRKEEQKEYENKLFNNGGAAEKTEPENKTDEKIKRVVMSLSITESDRKLLKKYSVDHDQTVSATIHQWIREKCL